MWLSQDRRCGFVEVGKHAVTIQEDSGHWNVRDPKQKQKS
jgi:hypothetical protein